jgi:hypothetical protein
MNYTLVRPQPAEAGVIRESSRHRAEVRHQFFNRHALERSREQLNGLTNQVIPFAKRERDSGSTETALALQQRNREAVFRTGMDRIGTRPRGQGEPRVAG